MVEHLSSRHISYYVPSNGISGGVKVVWAHLRWLADQGVGVKLYTHRGDVPRFEDCVPNFPIEPIRTAIGGKHDIFVFTHYSTLRVRHDFDINDPIYFVQMDERWFGNSTEVEMTYRRNDVRYVTIAPHLTKMIRAFADRNPIEVPVGLYRSIFNDRGRSRRKDSDVVRVLVYGAPAAHKGAALVGMYASLLKAQYGSRVFLASFHRDHGAPNISGLDKHFQPLAQENVAAIYRNSDIYLYPANIDGFAMTPLEAMACGCVPVLTDFPGKDAYAVPGFNCEVVPMGQPSKFMDAAMCLVEDFPHRQRLSQNAVSAPAPFDWSVVMPQTLRMFTP